MQLDWSREIGGVEMVEVCVFLNGRVDELAHIHGGHGVKKRWIRRKGRSRKIRREKEMKNKTLSTAAGGGAGGGVAGQKYEKIWFTVVEMGMSKSSGGPQSDGSKRTRRVRTEQSHRMSILPVDRHGENHLLPRISAGATVLLLLFCGRFFKVNPNQKSL